MFIRLTFMNAPTTSNESEYLLFLLIYASHVDFEFSPEERKSLKNQFPKSFSKVEQQFNALSEADQIIMLTDGMLNPAFKAKADEYEKLLQNHFWVDGKYCVFEKAFLKFYRQLSSAV